MINFVYDDIFWDVSRVFYLGKSYLLFSYNKIQFVWTLKKKKKFQNIIKLNVEQFRAIQLEQ